MLNKLDKPVYSKEQELINKKSWILIFLAFLLAKIKTYKPNDFDYFAKLNKNGPCPDSPHGQHSWDEKQRCVYCGLQR